MPGVSKCLTRAARTGTFDTRCVTTAAFAERALQLLIFTRSAIFNFTYCARHETRASDKNGTPRTIYHKHPEPDMNMEESADTTDEA
jgi:hypothetical protein